MSANNMFCITGRTTHDIHVFENRDGSHTIRMTVAVQNDYRNKDGHRGVQFVDVEAFVSAEVSGLGVYAYIFKGDLISVSGSIRSSTYQDKKTGETVFRQILNADAVTVLWPSKKKAGEGTRHCRAQAEA